MSDINVNIRGRDDGLGSTIDTLRQKASALGMEVGKLNNMTPTQQRQEVERASSERLRERKETVKSEYADVRKENNQEFNEMRDKRKSGEISKGKFDEFQKEFDSRSKETDIEENNELKTLERESVRNLRLILKELQDAKKIERETAQRDNKEFTPGSIGDLQQQNRILREKQGESLDDDERKSLQAEIDTNNEKIRGMRGKNDDDDDDDNRKSNPAALFGAAGAYGKGDIVGGVMQTPSAMKGAGMSNGQVAATGGVLAAVYAAYEFLNMDSKIKEALGPVSAMRGRTGRGASSNDTYKTELDEEGKIGNIGLDLLDFAGMMNTKAKATGKTDDIRERTFNDAVFQKGTGADAGVFNSLERFNKGQDSAYEISMDVLNVLTSIKESSLKEGDLAVLTEKLDSQRTIMDFQRQKRDVADTDSSLKILAAFESIGLSSKGEKGAGFMQNTLEGMGDGGPDNLMLLKYEAMKKAHPEKANDPAALRRMIRFHPDDEGYMGQMFKTIGEVAGDQDTQTGRLAMDDILMTMFPNANENDLEIYKKAIKSGNFGALLQGKGFEKLKTRKTTLTDSAIMEDAEGQVAITTQIKKDFQNSIHEASSSMMNFFTGHSEGGAIKVKNVDEKKPQPKPAARNAAGGRSGAGARH